ncbi:MAG: hypothetical protein ABF292_00430 [Desulfobacterales bacterium]|jgi:hypothetical protein
MIRSIKFWFIGMLVVQASLLLWVGPGASIAGDVGSDEFKHKIDALKNLQEGVTDCIDTALAVRADLTTRGREFAGEIKDVHQRHRYGSYAEAIRNPRVHYNLKLIQMVSGYTSALDEKIVFFKDSLEQIRFLYRQAEDEFKMMQTLGSLENASLLDRIDRLLIEYRAELKKDLIVSARISFRPCDAIWREIVDNSL